MVRYCSINLQDVQRPGYLWPSCGSYISIPPSPTVQTSSTALCIVVGLHSVKTRNFVSPFLAW